MLLVFCTFLRLFRECAFDRSQPYEAQQWWVMGDVRGAELITDDISGDELFVKYKTYNL